MDKLTSDTVSTTKAVGIILMVMAHAGCPGWLGGYIGTFHMPLFYLMSGFCFKMAYLDDPKTFVKRKFTGIWWPYVKWALLILALNNVFFQLNIYNTTYGYEEAHMMGWKEFFISVLNVFRLLSYGGQLLGGYWFVKELFWASLIGFVCIKFLLRFTYRGGVILCILLGVSYFEYGGVPIIGLWDRTWMATLFFLIGHEWRQMEEKYGWMSRFSALRWPVKISMVVLMGAVPQLMTYVTGGCGMLGFTYKQIIPYMFGAVFGTGMVFFACQWYMSGGDTRVRRLLNFIGRNTFEVLTWHFLCFKIVSLLIIVLYDLPIERLATFPCIKACHLREHGVDIDWSLWWWAYLVVGVGIPIGWQWIRWQRRNRQNGSLPA